jgi:hypothetical protein
MKIIHEIIIAITTIIMFIYGFGGLGLTVFNGEGYKPDTVAWLIIASAVILSVNSFIRRLKYA